MVRTAGICRPGGWCNAQQNTSPRERAFGRFQGILPQSRHRFFVSKSYFSKTLVSPMHCFIARHIWCWNLSFPVSAALYCPTGFSWHVIPEVFRDEGALLAFGAVISFLTLSCTESLSLKINPASSGGFWESACWQKNCCAAWSEVNSVSCLGNPLSCSVSCPSPALLRSSTPADSHAGRLW